MDVKKCTVNINSEMRGKGEVVRGAVGSLIKTNDLF